MSAKFYHSLIGILHEFEDVRQNELRCQSIIMHLKDRMIEI